MGTGTGICKIQNPRFPNSKLYKWPKLSELHAHLFGYVPDNLHDASVDVEACLKCYLEMLHVVIPKYYNDLEMKKIIV
jgi:DNA polymerase III epsilon subunit-like protein